MFEQLFEGTQALAHQRAGPLFEERLRHLNHLASQALSCRYLRHTAQYLLTVATRLRLTARPNNPIRLAEIELNASLWANRFPDGKQRHRSYSCFIGHASRWLRFLGRLQFPPAPPRPHAAHVDAFADHLRRERGLSPRTIDTYCPVVEAFLGDLDRSGHALEHLSITHVDEKLITRISKGGYARRTVQGLAKALRSFFRIAHSRGWCRNALADAIRSPRVYSQESLPVGPGWNDVQRLLACTEGDDLVDNRDRALLMLLAIYSFRASEVTGLRLEDFNWEREMLHLKRPKTLSAQIYPLSRRVGDAVLDYLKVRQRCAFREVFLRCRVPIRPLSRQGLWHVVAERFRRLGVTGTHRGPHAIRHACAGRLLEQGLSLKEIGDHLGRRNPDTTRSYTKVDLTRLRAVADFDIGGQL